jgi:hypothetical protein
MIMFFFRRTAHPDIRRKTNHSHRSNSLQTGQAELLVFMQRSYDLANKFVTIFDPPLTA